MIPVKLNKDCYKWADRIAINGNTKEVTLRIQYRDQSDDSVFVANAETHVVAFDETNEKHAKMYDKIIDLIEDTLLGGKS